MSDDEGAFIQMAGDDMDSDFSDDMPDDNDFDEEELPDSSIAHTSKIGQTASSRALSRPLSTVSREEDSLTTAIMLDSVPDSIDERSIDTVKDNTTQSTTMSQGMIQQNIHEYDSAPVQTTITSPTVPVSHNLDLSNEVKLLNFQAFSGHIVYVCRWIFWKKL